MIISEYNHIGQSMFVCLQTNFEDYGKKHVEQVAPIILIVNYVDGEGSSFAWKFHPPQDRVGAVVEHAAFPVAE